MIRQLYTKLLRGFQIALDDAPGIVRTQVCRATLKDIAAKYFLWGNALGLQEGHLELQHFQPLQNQTERNLSVMANLIVHSKNPGAFTLTIAHERLELANGLGW